MLLLAASLSAQTFNAPSATLNPAREGSEQVSARKYSGLKSAPTPFPMSWTAIPPWPTLRATKKPDSLGEVHTCSASIPPRPVMWRPWAPCRWLHIRGLPAAAQPEAIPEAARPCPDDPGHLRPHRRIYRQRCSAEPGPSPDEAGSWGLALKPSSRRSKRNLVRPVYLASLAAFLRVLGGLGL